MDGILYKDLMESYKQVHTPQELNEESRQQLSEIRFLRSGETVSQYDARMEKEKKERERKQEARYKDGGGNAKRDALVKQGYTRGQATQATRRSRRYKS